MRRLVLAVCLASWLAVVDAADQPVYEPAADWVVESGLPDAAQVGDEEPLEILLWDQQVHLDAGATHAYTRMALRINGPQGLMGLNTLSADWSPEYQTLAIHRVAIRRGEEVVNLLDGGRQFTVLRRESNLEFAMLDGALTAVLQPEGLRVGDIVDFAFTVSGADPTLEGISQSTLIAPQFPVQHAYLRASWDPSLNVRWQASEQLQETLRESEGRDVHAIEIDLDRPEPYTPPDSAPTRYFLGPHVELSTYRSWQQVASQMAPLFDRAVQLPPGSLVQEEIDRIRRAYDSPLERVNAALKMVQDEVRYLFVGLDFGGLVPATAEETWSRRFGDCKGKSALLLAMLHGLGFEAEPVLVHSIVGDALPDRLPMIGAFDHVIVRAEIEGEVYWLDGTNVGGQPLERMTTPLFHWGLPVRRRGAELVEIRPEPLAEPETQVAVQIDYSSGITAPGRIDGEIILAGDTATFFEQTVGLAPAAEREQSFRSLWSSYYPAAQVESVTGGYDAVSGRYSVTMSGTTRSLWAGGRYRSVVGDLVFIQEGVERPEGQDREAPYLITFPTYMRVRETLRLPQDGAGFRVDGEAIDMTVLGVEIRRSAHLDGAEVVIEGSARSLQSEIPASQVAEAEQYLAALDNRQLYVVAPTSYRPSADEQAAALGPAPESAQDFIDRGIVHLDNGRLDAAIADLTSAIDLAPDNSYGWANRGLAYVWQRDTESATEDLETARAIEPDNPVVFRAYGLLAVQQANQTEAIEQFTRAIEIDPESAFSYTMRANARMALNDLDGAFEDSRSATRLNPALADPYFLRATIHGMRGRQEQALAEFDAMLATASVDPSAFRFAAQILARFGERAKALEAIDKVFEVQPTAGDLLMRAGLRDRSEVEARQADFEAALELDPESRDARLGLARIYVEGRRLDEALRYLDALIEREPGDVEVLSERGIAYAMNGRKDRAALDFEAARADADGSLLNELCWRKATLDVALSDAVTECERAVELEENPAFYDSLGFVYLRLERYEDSVEAYDAALGLRPIFPMSLYGRALAKRELGDSVGYEQDAESAVRLQSDVPEVFEHYGFRP